MGGLAFVQPATFLYLGTQIWYGNVIPSCYLINSSDIKDYIMDKGWWNGFSKIYDKRKPKDEIRNPSKKDPEMSSGKKNHRRKSNVFPEISEAAKNEVVLDRPICENNVNDDINNSIQNQDNDQQTKNVILYDLDGIQKCQHIPEDIPELQIESSIKSDSKKNICRKNGEHIKASIFHISNNSDLSDLAISHHL